MEQPPERGIPGARRPRNRNRPRRRNQCHESALPQFSFTRNSADGGALSVPPLSNPPGLLAERGASVSSRAARAGHQNASLSGQRAATGDSCGGRSRAAFRGGPGNRGQRGGTRSRGTFPTCAHRTDPCRPAGTLPPGSDALRESNHQDGSAAAGHPERGDGDRRSYFPFRRGRRSTIRAVSFPSFADITAAGMCRRDDFGPVSKKAVLFHVYDCYLESLSAGARATLSSFRLIPDRGLGRVINSSNCYLPSLCGTAVAFCDPGMEYICYGEILTQGTEYVALLYDSVAVTSELTRHDFFLVNLNLDGGCFIKHLTALGLKSHEDLKWAGSLLSGEMCTPLGCGLGAVHNSAAMQNAASTPHYKLNDEGSADKGQAAAVKAALTSDRSVLIHTPSGAGDEDLLKAVVHGTLKAGLGTTHGPLLIAGSQIAQLFKDDMDGICDLDAEIINAANAAEECTSVIELKGKVNECLLKICEALQELLTFRTTVVHQSGFKGITREFASKRSEERNCIEKWLFYGISRRDMEVAVSAADFDEYRKDCKHMFTRSWGPSSSSRSVGFSYERAPQASRTPEAIPDTLKSVYIWKTLQVARADHSDMESTKCFQLERRRRWQFYKRWILSLEQRVLQKLEDAQNELMHCNLRHNKMTSERVTSPAPGTTVILSTVAAAVTHATITNAVQPKVLVLFRANKVPAFLAATLFSRGMTKLIFIGDNLCPQNTPAPSLWSFAFNRQGFEMHELSLQPLLSQTVCNLLAPLTKNVQRSCSPATAVKGVAEQAQFFDIPDKDEAFSMISRLCLHLQVHGYEPGDVSVVSLAPNAEVLVPALIQKLRQLKCAHGVWTLKAFYPKCCKILILFIDTGSIGADLAAALTRARCAVYGFGRLASADESCQNIFNTLLESRQGSRPFLSVSCVRHPGTVILIKSVRDFERSFRETGTCTEPCGSRKPCGHLCVDRCHEGEHPVVCYQPCSKTICSRKHSCRNRCSERCTQHCRVDVTATLPHCTHTATFPCYKWDTRSEKSASDNGPYKYKCTVPVNLKRDCGHWTQVLCFEMRLGEAVRDIAPHEQFLSLPPCQENVQVTPPCGHSKTIPCCDKARYECKATVMVERSCGHSYYVFCGDDRTRLPPCTEPVRILLSCGHMTYKKCSSRTIPPKCTAVVKRTLRCGHAVDSVCGSAIPLCSVPVSKTLPCGHVQIKVCHDTTSLCTRPCRYQMRCSHYCNLRCGDHPHVDKCQSCKDKCCVS